jgi:hypothetical protein
MPIGSLDHWPEDYERGRPGWPPEAVDVAGLPPSATVLEVGAGMGKLTRLLIRRFVRVLVVEPAEGKVPAGSTKPSIAAAEELLSARGPSAGEVGYDPLDLCSTRFASGEWRSAFAESAFEELREARVLHTQTVDRDGLVAFFASMGWIGDLPDAERLPLLDEVRSLVAAHEYRRRWETRVYWTRLV